jgi:hypothetical protein
MPKPDHILSFTTDKEGDQVFIHADAAGLDYLMRSLSRIRRNIDADVCGHDHLMTDAWGGHELTERGLDDGIHTVHHVKVYGWTPEWIQKHGFLAEPIAPPNGGPATPADKSGGTERPQSVS